MNEVLKTIRTRRSIRVYKSEQIEEAALQQILEAARYAPSGCNTQPWHFTVIQNREVIHHINTTAKEVMALQENDFVKRAGQNPDFDITYQAPTLIVVSGRQDAVTPRTDCDAAIQNMLLAAESLHIGSVWLGFVTFCFMKPGEAKKIGVPDGYEPYYGVALGYKGMEAQPEAPQRVENVVNYIR